MCLIKTLRLGLRDWRDDDIPSFAAMNRDVQVMEFYPKTLTDEETGAMVARIRDSIARNNFGLWAAEIRQTKEFIGFVGLSIPQFRADFTPCVEIGWRLAHPYWGKGYAAEAAHACLDYGFNTLKLREIVSFTSILNTRSISVMKRIGMEFAREFDHPNIEPDSRLRRHVIYIKKLS